jgi:hypothetical protein
MSFHRVEMLFTNLLCLLPFEFIGNYTTQMHLLIILEHQVSFDRWLQTKATVINMAL